MMQRQLMTTFAALLLATGCARAPGFMQPVPVRDWRATLSEARAAADSARWGTADRQLEEYGLRHPGTTEAHAALYWRGLFRMAPGNDSVSRSLAVPTLQRYLSTPGGAHRTEARLLLDVAERQAALVAEFEVKEREIAEIRAALGRTQDRPAASGTAGGAASAEAPNRNLANEVE
nr:hypothetical protein [Gemmatimonadaceae bacterium]